MKKEKEVKDKSRNNIFAAAFDELKRNHDITTQLELARRMGVNKDTVTNILHYRTPVSEDIITKLQTASGCIFNLQWLRGESDVMLAANVKKNNNTTEVTLPSSPDMSSMINSIIAAKDDAIASLKREIASKDETIATKDTLIKTLQQQVSDLLAQLAIQKGLLDGYLYPAGVADHDQRTAKRL